MASVRKDFQAEGTALIKSLRWEYGSSIKELQGEQCG